MRYRKILHPTDYSEHSRPAFGVAVDLACEHKAQLVLLHAVETLGLEHATYGEVASETQPEGYRKRLWEEFHQAMPASPELQMDYVLSEEDAVTAILRTAAELRCDLIVMGTHGTSGWRRWFTSSIAEAVVRKAACHVLVVKAGAPAEELPPPRPTDLHPGRLIESEEKGRLPLPPSSVD